MPRIAAPTVAEHHENVHERLVDAAESLMRGGEPLTAAAVSGAAGIARNSIYRYVDSVDDLRALVVARYLPSWLAAVEGALAEAHDPTARVVAWVRSNLVQADASGHGWLMEAVRPRPADRADPHGIPDAVERAHAVMRETITTAWLDLLDGDPVRTPIAAGLTLGLLEAGFRQLRAGSPAGEVIDLAGRAAEGLVRSLTPTPQGAPAP